MSHGHLVGQLLQLELLVLDEAAAPGAHGQAAVGLVVRAALRAALVQGYVLRTKDLLEELRAADLAVVRDHRDLGFHVRGSGHHALHFHEVTNICT